MVRIGITCSHSGPPTELKKQRSLRRYVDSLAEAGAESVLLWRPEEESETEIVARAEELAAQLDGVLLSGGADLPPESYGQTTLPNANVNLVHALRPHFETHLVREMRKQNKPLFGICYGCQFFNVLRGGTLYQDIPLQHADPIEHHESRHMVRVEPNSLLDRIVGQSEFEVASYHHQAIDQPADDVRVAACASDGIIEAIEMDENPFWLGVQWHPEWDPESDATRKIFAAFVAACRN